MPRKFDSIAPETTVESNTETEAKLTTVSAKPGKKRKRVKAHIAYEDLITAIKVRMPIDNDEILVKAPGTKVGLAASMYIPAVMLHRTITWAVEKMYLNAITTDIEPRIAHLKDLLMLLEKSSGLMDQAWNMGKFGNRKGDKASTQGLQCLIGNFLTVHNSVAGGDGNMKDMNMDDLMQSLKKIEIEATKAVDVMEEDSARKGFSDDWAAKNQDKVDEYGFPLPRSREKKEKNNQGENNDEERS